VIDLVSTIDARDHIHTPSFFEYYHKNEQKLMQPKLSGFSKKNPTRSAADCGM